MALHDDGFVKMNKEDFEKHKEPLRLQPWARIEGTLTVGDKPGKQMTMGLNVDPREHGGHGNGKPVVQFSYFQNQADDNGKFVFDRVVPGKGSVTKIFEQKDLSGDIVSWRPQILTPYEIKSGETKTVNIGGGGRPVVGKVMVPAESPDTAKRRSVFVEAKLQLFAGKSPNSGDAISSDAWQFYAVPLQKAEDRYPGWATPIAEVEKEIRDWEKSAEGQAAMAKDPELYKKARSAMDERIAVEKSREISDASVRCASVDAEGNFRIDDVTPGDWTITAVLEERNKPQDGVIVFVPPVKAEKTLTVPAGDLDEPVDVGTIELKLK